MTLKLKRKNFKKKLEIIDIIKNPNRYIRKVITINKKK